MSEDGSVGQEQGGTRGKSDAPMRRGNGISTRCQLIGIYFFTGGPDGSGPRGLPQEKSSSHAVWNEDCRLGPLPRPPKATILPGDPQGRVSGDGIGATRRQSESLKLSATFRETRSERPNSCSFKRLQLTTAFWTGRAAREPESPPTTRSAAESFRPVLPKPRRRRITSL